MEGANHHNIKQSNSAGNLYHPLRTLKVNNSEELMVSKWKNEDQGQIEAKMVKEPFDGSNGRIAHHFYKSKINSIIRPVSSNRQFSSSKGGLQIADSSKSISPYSVLSSIYYPQIQECLADKHSLWKGHYQIRKEIGQGQYGKVFLARDILKAKEDKFKRVAIKVLNHEENENESESDSDKEIEHLIFKSI